MPYIVDTDALVHVAARPDAGAAYVKLIQMVHDGELFTVEQVLDEMKRWPEIREMFVPLKSKMCVQQYIPEVLAHVGYISEQFDFLFDLHGSRNPDPADPWLIGCAKHYGLTLVTDERTESTKKIPYVCRQQGVDVTCISGTELVWKAQDAYP